MTYYDVGAVGDPANGEMRAVEAGGVDVLLVCVAGTVYAVDAICSHALGYLDEGQLIGFEIHCPLHSGSFDVRTGSALSEPATEPIRCYGVHIDGSRIRVGIDAAAR